MKNLLFKFFNFFENLLIIRHSFDNHLYGSLFIYQESDAAAGIKSNEFSLRVGNQRECEIQFFGKFDVAVKAVFTYTQDLGVEPLKGLDVLLKGRHLGGSATGEIFKIKGKQDISLTKVIRKPDGTLR